MAKRRKLINIDDKCRVCLGDDGCMSDIFAEELRTKINDFGDSTSIHINNDENLPRNICHVCLYKLDMWIEFKRQFLRSNTLLLEHLGVSELSDNATSVTKRKHSELQECHKDNSPEHDVLKKMKSTETIAMSTDEVRANSKCEPISIESTSPKTISDNVGPAESKRIGEDTSRIISAASPVKQIIGRRGKTTERRKASTKRWVARKKALLAATGENDTDTDSMSSDDGQLSPVQKARAKCNAEKVAETQRRMTKALRSYESNVTDYYGTKRTSDSYVFGDSDSESRKNKKSTETMRNVRRAADESGDSCQPLNDLERNKAILSESNKLLGSSIVETGENSVDTFFPHSVRSELTVEDASFVVTSTLVLTEPHCLKPVAMSNSSKTGTNADAINQERNTDIIDAVQLRRVSPKSPLPNDKKFVERCLNIEVEGTELEVLRRVQSELANFVETQLFKSRDTRSNENNEKTVKDSFKSLDQQLKTIVEKTIKKNLETSRNDKLTNENRGNNTFTGHFVEAAMRSKIFQPRVILVRFDGKRDDRADNSRAINKKTTISSCKANEPSSVSLGKRRSVQPAKFADYDRSPFNTESEESNDVATKSALITGPKCSKVKTYGPALTKEGSTTTGNTGNQQDGQKFPLTSRRETLGQSVLISSRDKVPSSVAKSLAINENSTVAKAPLTNDTNGEKHICGVCGESFGTRKQVEIHFAYHKKPNSGKQPKQKMMRCKRCHVIVEARYVKLHVCNAPKNLHKCYICAATFRSDQLLVKHLEIHSADENIEIDATTKTEVKSVTDIAVAPEDSTKDSVVTAKKRNLLQVAGQSNETYTCFVCDKIFHDEEILKDHLQKHCDDISDEEHSNDDKEQYQCAICGDSLESEDALESHVEKHLFDDEDDNPNLISIGGNDRDKTTKNEMIHVCSQCSETFDSEMLLMLHMQAHEEEVAIAEWERRGVDDSHEEQHICVICDEIFTTEAELSEHLDVHNGNAHICLLCDKPFITLEELQCHVNTH